MNRRQALLALLLSPRLARAASTLYLYNWNNYISENTLRRFEARCGCIVKQDFYSDNEEMLAKLEAGATGYDLLVPTGNTVETLIRQQALRPIERHRLTRLGNLKPEFLDLWFDRGNRYSIPYAYSITLLGYHAERIADLGLPQDSWALIFEPRHLQKLQRKVTVLNSQKELMAAAMIYLGHDIHGRDPTLWNAAKALILRAKPYWAAFSNSTYIKDLAVGNIWVAHGYSNDMFRAEADARAARRPFRIAYATPQEGAVLAVDNMVLPRGGRNPALAHRFIDFMLEGENAAGLSNLIGAGNPNAAATAFIEPAVAANSEIFPPPEKLRRLKMIRDFDARERRVLARMWTEIKVK